MKPKTRVSLVVGAVLAGTAAFLLAATCAEIDKFYWVDDRIATGGQPLLEQIPALKREGFRTIINLREPSEYDAAAEAAEAERLGLRYVSIPFRAVDPKEEPVDKFLATMADRKIWPAFAHCGSGNRIAALWMIHRVVVARKGRDPSGPLRESDRRDRLKPAGRTRDARPASGSNQTDPEIPAAFRPCFRAGAAASRSRRERDRR